MRTFPLLMLVASSAGAQQATMNCRSAASPCQASDFYGQRFFTTLTGNPGVVLGVSGNMSVGVGFNTSTNSVNITNGGSVSWVFDGSTGNLTGQAASRDVLARAGLFNHSAGNTAISVQTSGAWLDLGGGSADRMKSDGTNVLVDTNLLPNSRDTTTLGGVGAEWQTVTLARGAILNEGDVVKWTSPPLSDNTTRESQLVVNDMVPELVHATATRKYNPLGQRKEWTVEKRSLDMDIGIENSACPVFATGIRGTGAAAVTVTCTDAAAAGTNAISGEHYRVLNTTTTINTVSIVDESADCTELASGPKLIQRISIPSGSTSSVRIWVAIVPDGTSLSGVDTGAVSVVGFRFSTAVPDTNWQACSGDGTSVACTDTGTAPATGTNLVLEVDCRETTACRFLINGSLVATRSSTLPASGTNISHRVLVQTLNTTAKALWHGRSSLLTN